MTTPIGPSPNNPYGIGMGNNSLGTSALQNAGIGINGTSVTPSGLTALGSGRTIYMGTKKGTAVKAAGPYAPGYRPPMETLGGGMVADRVSYAEAIGLPVKWARDDPKKLQEFVNKGILYKIPGFSPDMGLPEIMDRWKLMVDSAEEFTKGTQTDWSPFDVMESYSDTSKKFGTQRQGDWIVDLNTGQRIKYVGKTKKTSTEKRVDLSSAEDVKALTTQVLTEALGRIPTADEIAQFKSTINSLEQATPEVVTTTEEFRPVAGGEQGMELERVGSTSTRTGGLSEAARQLAVQENVRETPEYQKYQGGTTYFNALMQMISGGF